MAKTEKPTSLNWKEKLDKGITLSPLEETQADADFNYRQRLDEAKRREEFERLKNRGRVRDESEFDDIDGFEDDSEDNTNNRKGTNK